MLAAVDHARRQRRSAHRAHHEAAIGLALLRGGALLLADFDAPSLERRMLALLLRQAESFARRMRWLEEVTGRPAPDGQ